MLLSWGRLPGVRGTGELGAWDGAKSSRRRARGAVAGSALAVLVAGYGGTLVATNAARNGRHRNIE